MRVRRRLVALALLVGLTAILVPASTAGAYTRQFLQYASPSCNTYVTFDHSARFAAVDPVSGCYQVGARLYYTTSAGHATSTGWVWRFNGGTATASVGGGTATKAVFFIWSTWHKNGGYGGTYLTCYPAASSAGACVYGWK